MTTSRSIIIGFILVILLSVWTIYSEHLVGSLNSISPPPGAIFLFFLIVLTNSLIKYKKLRLQQSELIVLYSLLLVAAPISSFAVIRFFMSTLLAPFYFATPENEFETIFHGIVPQWFAPRSPNVVNGFYETLERGVPWKAWIEPLSIWIGLILVFYLLMLCMSVIVHKHWIDRERLTFPTVYLPMQLAREPEADSVLNSFLKNKFLWLGFALPVIPLPLHP